MLGKNSVDEVRRGLAYSGAENAGRSHRLKHWYVAQVAHGRERFVQRELYPIIHCVVPLANGSVLFRDYVFIRMDLERDPWQRINRTRGVKGLLFGEKPVAIPAREDIVALLESRSKRKRLELVRGMIVQISDGPFKGLNGTVDHESGGIAHLLLGSLPVAISSDCLIECTSNTPNS